MRRPDGDSGAAALEFAIVLPVLLLLLTGLTAFGLREVYAGSAEHAARRAVDQARYVQGRTVAQMAGAVCTAALDGLTARTEAAVSGGTAGTCAPGTVTACYRPPRGGCRSADESPVPGDRVITEVTVPLPLSRSLGLQDLARATGTAVGQVER